MEKLENSQPVNFSYIRQVIKAYPPKVDKNLTLELAKEADIMNMQK